jgi:hypothetical protein
MLQRSKSCRWWTLSGRNVAFLTLLTAPVAAAPPLATPASSFTVNCGAGQTVADALAKAARSFGPVVITVSGVCAERVVIARDDVTLQGAAPDDGFTSPAAGRGDALIKLDGARRITIQQLTLSPRAGSTDLGMVLERGAATALISNLVINAVDYPALALFEGSFARIQLSEIHGGGKYVQVSVGASRLELFGVTLENAGGGVFVFSGGTLEADDLTVRGHSGTGIGVSENGSVRILGVAEITGNLIGVAVSSGGMALVAGGHIADNQFDGIVVSLGAKVTLSAVVEDNLSTGVRVSGGSAVNFGRATIRNNKGSGISLADTSIAVGGPNQVFITGNGQWGIYCAPSPAVAQVTSPGFPAANVTGNAAGASNCPSLGQPDRIP